MKSNSVLTKLVLHLQPHSARLFLYVILETRKTKLGNKQERLQAHERQIHRLKRRIEELDHISNRYSWIRVAIFFIGLLLSILAFFIVGWWLSLVLVALTIITFSIVAYYQRQIDRSITRHKLWQKIKSTHRARMQLDWDNIPSVYTPGPQANHPFETDLDITGARSVQQLLNTAISHEGKQRLQSWLLNTVPNLATIRHRQTLVHELAPMTIFRDKLTLKSVLAAKSVAEQLEGKRLLQWLNAQPVSSSLVPLLWGSAALSLLTILLFVANIVGLLPQFWIFSLLCSLLVFLNTKKQRGDLFDDAYYLRDSFAMLGTIFHYLEKYPYGTHTQLKKLCEPFFTETRHRPSTLLKKVARIASAATLEKNRLLWLIINTLIPWDNYYAYRLQRYKKQIALRLSVWLDTWFELEALNSLATFAYLNPEYILPEVQEALSAQQLQDAKCVLFQAHGLGHPLIPIDKKVTNDFVLNELGHIVIITGSNMSGKSTFLRTLGVNLCLAYAGAPVNAHSFQTTLFRIFTCIRVSDSVTDGYSYFYAEVKRLKALLVELEQPYSFPLFFLIDEIFKGTNNRERLIGSRAYIKALIGRNCVGVISTHDLELVKLADSIPHVTNAHFREEVIDAHMVFDYLLRPGPSPTTNALKIMQMEGLPVPDTEEAS